MINVLTTSTLAVMSLATDTSRFVPTVAKIQMTKGYETKLYTQNHSGNTDCGTEESWLLPDLLIGQIKTSCMLYLKY